MEFEWQQVSSSLQDSSQYSSQSKQCCSLDGLHLSSHFQVVQSLNQSFRDCTKSTNYNWHHHHFHVQLFFQFSSKVLVLVSLFAFFQVYSLVQNLLFGRLLLLTITQSSHLADIRWSVCISKSLRSLCILLSRTDSGLCIYHLFVWSNFNFLYNSQ